VLELSLREARQLGHNYIGTEHILLGLIRDGDGVAAQVLVKLGADLNRVRQQVIQLLHGHQVEEPVSASSAAGELRLLPGVQARLEAVEQRLTAIEHRIGTGPDASDLDERIAQIRREKESAIDANDFEQATSLRNREKELLASKAERQEQWAAAHPALPNRPSGPSSSPTRTSGSAPCSASTVSTRKTSQPDVKPGSASRPGPGPCHVHPDRRRPTSPAAPHGPKLFSQEHLCGSKN
jgi:ATP-dependent Clp protease ATP-binding subunit ClpA